MRSLNKIKHGLSILALAVSTQSALAAEPWQINPLGSGTSGASTVSALDVSGIGFVQMQPDANVPELFNFIEHGAYQALSFGSSSPSAGNEITVSYSVSGSGSSVDPGALRLTAGRIDLYSDSSRDFGSMAPNYGADNGTHIASFNVSYGYVANSQGMVVVNATGVAGSFASGYLFNSAGADLATLSNVQLQLSLFNQPITPDGPMIAGVVCGIAAACPEGNFSPSPLAFTVQDRGAVSISAVPEPESSAMFLAGLGLLTVVARRRRG
ncbi:MAG: flocculation-associated PEP-CTERM protein PepA [Azonexaceae bacterium]|nr:flocculation-associated PEP-CTERM protein PepA [Azonexaceae bacterium]